MSKTIDRNIFLIGFMGAGKSTIARSLQKSLKFPLVEMDERIVREQGMSVNEIFEKYPILSKVTNQSQIIDWIDQTIDESLKTLREIVSNNTAKGNS